MLTQMPRTDPNAYEEYMKFANDPKRGGAYNFIRGKW